MNEWKEGPAPVRRGGIILATLMGAALAGCGGGGGSSSGAAPAPAAPPPQAAAPVSVVSSGIITGFSSVFVGGVRYEVEADSVVALEDEAEVRGDDSDLRIGMKVRIQAEDDGNGNRVAQRIEYDDDLTGPVSNVQVDPNDPTIGTFEACS